MRKTVSVTMKSPRKRTASISTIVSVEGVVIPDTITTEFISFKAFNEFNKSFKIINPSKNLIQSLNEFDIIDDFDSIYFTVNPCLQRTIPFFNYLSRSQKRVSKRYSRDMKHSMIGSGVIPTYDFTVPLCCSLLNSIDTLDYSEVLGAMDNHVQLKENFNTLKTNKFQTVVCELLPPAQRISLSLLLLSLTNSPVFKSFQVAQLDKTGFSNDDIHVFQRIVMGLAKPLKQLFRRFCQISRISREMAVIFSGYLVAEEDKIGCPNELGYKLIQTASRYEDFVLRGTDGTGIYDIVDSNTKVALCLNVEKLSTLLFSKEAIELGYVRFYMTTLPYFTTPETVLNFIIDNKHLKYTCLKDVYEVVCFEFLKLWQHALPVNAVSLLQFTALKVTEDVVKHPYLASCFEEKITALMFNKLNLLTVSEMVKCDGSELEEISIYFNKWVKQKLIQKQDYQKMLKYADTFIELKNYDCAYSIFCGLQSHSWMSEKKQEKYSKSIEKNSTFKLLNGLFDPSSHCSLYKDTLILIKPPFIPVVVLIKQNLLIANETPTFVDNNSRLIRIDDKLRVVYTSLNMFLRGRTQKYSFYVQSESEIIQLLRSVD